MFDELIQCDCYLCGKASSEMHVNGIDRCDNNEGYTENNSLPCCSDCNFMKNNFTMEEFTQKCLEIYSHIISVHSTFHEENKNIPTILLHKLPYLDKKTEEEKRDTRRQQVHLTTEKYTEEYIKSHVQELIEKRKLKENNEY
jgi:hypothetical protein